MTGGGRGIGRAYARALSAEGASVVVSDLADKAGGTSAAETVAAEIRAAGGRAVANHADVADIDDVRRMVETALEKFGRLDILVANAGITRPAPLYRASPADWNATLAVHATGTFNCIHEAAPALIKGGGGSIITVGDITTGLYYPKNGAYRAAKATVAVISQYVAEELREFNINVNTIMPGATATDMVDTYLGSIADLGDEFDKFVATANAHFKRPAGVSATGPAGPETVPPLGVYLCTGQARAITGCHFQVTGGLIRLISSHTEPTDIRSDHNAWNLERLANEVPALVSKAKGSQV
ncbi:3-oxoacyl-(acyl-carrier-protein) reductase [Streptomyces malaysiensis]|uniref:3-oxoacyl-(Acyl-carrier-protein) reductase n=1 Tax=Streptomyces malaysiensis TaxID=92644 RepID=A0A7X5XBI4_STRMQ|nr:3-oxoacyl-(acyl-carrier-protein) reductase [Streptomyces malaysiensis]